MNTTTNRWSGKPLALLLAAACLLLSASGLAATVNFGSGDSGNYVLGNPTIQGGTTGIGGTISLPSDNANSSGNIVNVTSGTVSNSISGGYFNSNNSVSSNNKVKHNRFYWFCY